MKATFKFFNALLVILLVAVGVNHAAPAVQVQDAFVGLFGVAAGWTIIKHSYENAGFNVLNTGALYNVVLLELWERELIQALRVTGREWMSKIRDHSQWVGNNVIHLHEIGADPDVLIDNTTYPIASAQRTDDEIPISLHKYDTTNTIITDDELYGLPYDKEGSTVRQHREKLEGEMAEHGLHKMCAAGDTADTPVLETTGANNGAGRNRLIREDLVNFKKRCDDLKLPKAGRSLVLCGDHANDLILVDDAFRDRYHNTESGKILGRLYGFDIYEDVYNPVFDAAVAKKAYGAAAAGTDKNASTFFLNERMARARGTVKAYKKIAAEDPDYRQSKLGYRVYGVMINKTLKGTGAIVSGTI